MTPERIYAALGPAGTMAAPGAALLDADRRRIAEFMAGRPLGSAAAGSATTMQHHCEGNPALSDPTSQPQWNGWSTGSENHRFQPTTQAGIDIAQVPRLRLKWVFGYPAGVSSNTEPTIVAGRLFVGSDNGHLYALDARSGCIYWAYQAGSIIRGAAVVGPDADQSGHTRLAVYFGDGHANVFALDARVGTLLWKTRVDDHFVARITAAPRLYGDKLLVPVSSSEGYGAGTPDYPCCTSRGSVVALDTHTGKLLWKAWVIAAEPKPYLRQPNGVWLSRPAGGPVWNTPTVDAARQAVYFGTGDASAAPAPATTDAVMAVDLDSGRTLWSYQSTAGDVRVGGCAGADRSPACPEVNGPDMDIGNSPMLVKLTGARRALLFGTKAADILAIDPDADGRLLYRVNPTGAAPGGVYRAGAPAILWGGATDGQRAYYALGSGGLVAIDPASGQRLWRYLPANKGDAGAETLGAAPTAIPGVVFEGSSRGVLYALDAADGHVLWQFDTAQRFATVNGVAAHGGAIASSGAVAVGGMLYVGSGYAVGNGASAGNVLAAFEPRP
jgi:polyvinyl alcohol dehydrogenase (cytochrome)